MGDGLTFRVLAYAVMVAHAAFVLFVVAGGVAVRWSPRLAWIHLPCVFWGIVVEAFGLTCPLTPLENEFRARAGIDPYAGDILIHLMDSMIYPGWLTRDIQVVLAVIVAAVNVAVYGSLLVRKRGC
ncbi:MAG TPA: DUF2784 domain-containing protein [Deltaproteobacteria bacterium]|nr:DUF2784 domain-containing protein [Deltaproteobacteria bacterium]